jgi:hypothetical protein
MQFYGKAEETGQVLLQAFAEGRVPAALAPMFINDPQDRYCARWSWLNQLLVSLHGYNDARSYKGWQEVGRQVRKGEKAFYILEPLLITKWDEQYEFEYKMVIGFKAGARFGIEQTDGEPLADSSHKQAFIDALPLIDVARAWGIEVITYSGQTRGAKGVYQQFNSGREVIALGVENLSTWAHELVHAADHRMGTLTEKGQHWASETVAELGGCILLHLLGMPEEADSGGCWQYIQRYAEEAEIEPMSACVKLLERTCKTVNLILDTAMKV